MFLMYLQKRQMLEKKKRRRERDGKRRGETYIEALCIS
jgi:hypothetical protein